MTGTSQTHVTKLSVVTTLYRSERFLPDFYQRMTAAVRQITESYELIFVDDGSPDSSGDWVKQQLQQDSKVKLVELSRNFGHHQAIMAGLRESQGNLVFLIDVDLEDKPEWLIDFHQKLQDESLDVVYGVQQQRGGTLFRRWTGELFYKLFNALSEVKIPANLCTARLMTREYVNALASLSDRNLFLAGNCAWTGFRQAAVPVDKKKMRSDSSYTLAKKIQMVVSAITAFTAYPLQMIFTLGLFIAALAGLMGVTLLVRKLFYPDYILLGYASMMVSLWFLGGLIILFVGVVGLYLSKVFNEVKGRPQYLVRRVYVREDDHETHI